MDRCEIKKKLLDACIMQQRKLADNAIHEMDEAYKSAYDYGTPEDWFDTHKMDMLNKRDIYGQHLQKALEDIRKLERINASELHDTVRYGSVVITDNQKMFIALGIGKICIENDVYYAISLSVPLFQIIKNLRKGDVYEFRGLKNKIIDVF